MVSLLLRQKKSLIFKDFFYFHRLKILYNPMRTQESRFSHTGSTQKCVLFVFGQHWLLEHSFSFYEKQYS